MLLLTAGRRAREEEGGYTLVISLSSCSQRVLRGLGSENCEENITVAENHLRSCDNFEVLAPSLLVDTVGEWKRSFPDGRVWMEEEVSERQRRVVAQLAREYVLIVQEWVW
jgi:hypothetical protein